MFSFLYAGLTLGTTAGFSPGPLTALLLRETLQRGRRAGFLVAAAPLLTDGPIILLAWLFARQLADAPLALAGMTCAGALFVGRIGVNSLRCPAPSGEDDTLAGSLRQAIVINSLSPHPWLFWALVGTPILSRALQTSPFAAPAFLGLFYLGLVGAKLLMAWLVGRYRSLLQGRAYRWVLRILGLVLLGLALQLLLSAWNLLHQSPL